MDIKVLTAQIGAKQEAVHETVSKLDKKVGVQNGRIGKLEAWRNYLLGAWGVIFIVAGIIWKML